MRFFVFLHQLSSSRYHLPSFQDHSIDMGKARFTSLDVRRVVNDLSAKLVGLRLANIYDINKKTYLFKFVKPDVKVLLLSFPLQYLKV